MKTEISDSKSYIQYVIKSRPDIVDYLIINSRHMHATQMTTDLGIGPQTIERICSNLNISILKQGDANPFKGVTDNIGALPEGSILKVWAKGTVLKYPVNTKGYKSITRHFSETLNRDSTDD